MTGFNLKNVIQEKNPRILIVRLSAIGDVIETLPAIHLRQHFPKAYIGWVLENAPYLLLQGHPEVDKFFLFPKKDISHAIKKGQWSKASQKPSAILPASYGRYILI